jgi:hypothetical protein
MRSEARNHTSSCFTYNSEVRSNESSCFTSNSEDKSKEYIYTPPFREGPFGLYQAYLESVQTLHEIKSFGQHISNLFICANILGASRLLSVPCHESNDSGSLCASTCHGIQDSLSSLCNSCCHIGSWLLPSLSQTGRSATFEAI